MQAEGNVQTRDSNTLSSSILHNPVVASSESSPLLSSRHGLHSQSTSGSASSTLEQEYRFDLKREKLRCKKMFYDRFPKGKAVFVVFLVNFLESFAFHGALELVRFTVFQKYGIENAKADFLFTILYFTGGRVFYPLAGLIADVYVGRYRVIHAGLWMFLVGFGIMLMSMALEWQHYDPSPVAVMIATVFFMLGSASVESTIIPFGVDQIQQGASSDELSSYFFWYYFVRNLGYVFNVVCSVVTYAAFVAINKRLMLAEFTHSTIAPIYRLEHTIIHLVLGIIFIVGIAVAIFLHFCLQHWFFKARHRENPIRSICNILYFAATVKRQAPRYRRSFRYGEEKKSRLELAKVEFDGIFSAEEVEDVKTFFRVLFLVMSLGLGFATYGAVSLLCRVPTMMVLLSVQYIQYPITCHYSLHNFNPE